MKRKKIYLYAGYYEMFITDSPMDKPYGLISWHWKLDRAIKRAEKEHPDDNYYFQVELYPDDYEFVLESFIMEGQALPISEVQGRNFYIL